MPNDIEVAFGAGLIPDSIKGKIDIPYLIDCPSRSAAQSALDFLSNQTNEIELRKRHSPAEMLQMWRGVLRGCLAHGVPLSDNQRLFAKTIGVVLP